MDKFDGWAVIPRGWAMMTAVRCLGVSLRGSTRVLVLLVLASSAARAAQPRGPLSTFGSVGAAECSSAVRTDILIWQNAIGLMAHAINVPQLGVLETAGLGSWRSWPTLLHAQPWMGGWVQAVVRLLGPHWPANHPCPLSFHRGLERFKQMMLVR